MGRISARILAVSVLFSGLPAVAGTLDDIRASGELKLAYRVETPPFSSKAPDAAEPQGFTIDLCRIIASDIQRQLGLDELEIRWVKVNADDRINAIAEGRAHIECAATTITLSRQEKVDFSNLIYATGASLMRLARNKSINNIMDLNGKRVSVVTGTTTEPVLRAALQQNGINAQVVMVDNHADGLQRLVNKKVDAMAADQATLFGIGFNSRGENDLVITEDMLSFEPYGLPLPRNDADFRLAVNRSLSNLYARGDVGRSWQKWFGQHGVRPTQMLLTLYRLNTFVE